MKTVSAMDVRRGLGGILDEVRLKSETFILERAGKAIAMITPIERGESPSDQQGMRLAIINELKGVHSASARGEDVGEWLNSEREDWGDMNAGVPGHSPSHLSG